MAFSTKGWRRIVVADRTFYWQAGNNDWQSDPWVLFRARPKHEPGRSLTAVCGRCGHYPVTFAETVVPRVVGAGIKTAVQSGWLADRPAARFVLFNDPQRFVALDPRWLTTTVRALAAGIYQDQAFDRMPILADALQDAGCDNADVLDHCRDTAHAHVRGCWVVDLVLGKS